MYVLQEKFHIVDSTTKAALQMFTRNKERHVFLFEKVLVLSKKATNRVGDSKKPGSPSFLYKEHYLVSVKLNLLELVYIQYMYMSSVNLYVHVCW